MAKKQTIKTGLFDRTEASQASEARDPARARGVSLKASEWEALEAIAQTLGLNLHGISQYAIRYFLAQYKAGAIKTETKKTLTLPGL